MEKNIFARLIATALNLQERAVANTLALLEEGCTIPFISRYRKERTGGLDEVQIAAISDRFDKLHEIQKRKETVVKTITDLGKLTPELQKRIEGVAHEPRWLANRDWSLSLRFSCFSENAIQNVPQNALSKAM